MALSAHWGQPNLSENDIGEYKSNALALLANWKDVELPRGGLAVAEITPYLHKALHHVPAILARWGSLQQFSGQVLERNNTFTRYLALHKCNFALVEQQVIVYDAMHAFLYMFEHGL